MCGLCIAVCPVGALGLTQSGSDLSITFKGKCVDCGICYQICPGKNVPLKDLDRFLFGRERDLKVEFLGIIKACYQANAADPEIRAKGASGGVVTALLVYALEKRLISAANVIVFDKEQPWKAKPMLATTREEIINAAQSKYVIVPANAALTKPEVSNLSGALACVGLPCHVHGIQKLRYYYSDHFLSKKVAFIIGIHCGGATSMGRNESWLRKYFGVESLNDIERLSYRKGKGNNAYAEVVRRDGELIRLGRSVSAGPRDNTAERCMLCWDWSAELSDVSVGDFFGPAASGSDVHLGASTLIVRTQFGEKLVRGAVEEGYLKIYPTPIDPVVRSYGFMVKKHGRATALVTFKKYGLPCPDYQYEVEPMGPLDKESTAIGTSIEERELFWAKRGIYPLS